MSHGQGKGRYKLQALVYDILPSEEGAGKRCSECGAGVVLKPEVFLHSFPRRSGSLTSVKNAVVAAGQTEHRLQLPDYVWKENGSNVLLLEVQSSVPVHVTEVKLERRPQLGEKVSGVLFVPALDTKST